MIAAWSRVVCAALVAVGVVVVLLLTPAVVASAQQSDTTERTESAASDEEAGGGQNGASDADQSLLTRVKDVVTVVGILLGGFWAFYVFVRGRGFAGTMQIEIQRQHVDDTEGQKACVVSVRVKNVGRTLVRKIHVTARVMAVGVPPLMPGPLKLLEPTIPKDPSNPEIKSYDLFENTRSRFEPGEDAVEDLLLLLGVHDTARVEVIFAGRLYSLIIERYFRLIRRELPERWRPRLRRQWFSRKIFRVLEGEETVPVSLV